MSTFLQNRISRLARDIGIRLSYIAIGLYVSAVYHAPSVGIVGILAAIVVICFLFEKIKVKQL